MFFCVSVLFKLLYVSDVHFLLIIKLILLCVSEIWAPKAQGSPNHPYSPKAFLSPPPPRHTSEFWIEERGEKRKREERLEEEGEQDPYSLTHPCCYRTLGECFLTIFFSFILWLLKNDGEIGKFGFKTITMENLGFPMDLHVLKVVGCWFGD